MRSFACGVVLAIAGVVACASMSPAFSQQALVRPLAPAAAPTGVVLQAASALGMVRGPGSNVFDAVNRIRFVTSGSVFAGNKPYKIERAVNDIAYHLAAERVDRTEIRNGKTSRVIEVVSGDLAWNETKPGEGARAVNAAQQKSRSRALWMTPHGFLSQVMKLGPSQVTIGAAGAEQTLSFMLNGERITGFLGADHRPARIEAQVNDPALGKGTLAIAYSGYKDFDLYALQFPEHITTKFNGKTISDLTVTEFRTGPYIVFPTPPGMRVKTASR